MVRLTRSASRSCGPTVGRRPPGRTRRGSSRPAGRPRRSACAARGRCWRRSRGAPDRAAAAPVLDHRDRPVRGPSPLGRVTPDDERAERRPDELDLARTDAPGRGLARAGRRPPRLDQHVAVAGRHERLGGAVAEPRRAVRGDDHDAEWSMASRSRSASWVSDAWVVGGRLGVAPSAVAGVRARRRAKLVRESRGDEGDARQRSGRRRSRRPRIWPIGCRPPGPTASSVASRPSSGSATRRVCRRRRSRRAVPVYSGSHR